MSLIGDARPTGCRSPLQNINKLKFLVTTDGTIPGTVIEGYTGVELIAIDANKVFVFDIPTTFNNLQDVQTNPLATPLAAVLVSAMAYALSFQFGPLVVSNAVWFPVVTGPLPPENPQHTRVWFALQDQAGVSIFPSGPIVVDLTVSNGPVKTKALT